MQSGTQIGLLEYFVPSQTTLLPSERQAMRHHGMEADRPPLVGPASQPKRSYQASESRCGAMTADLD
jgi:hypothetical protein